MSIDTTPITEAAAMRMFNVDLGAFVEGTNQFVDEADRIMGDELDAMYGITMFAPAREKRDSKVVDPSAMDADELRAAQRVERAERVAQLTILVEGHTIAKLETENVCLTSLLPPPTHTKV